MRKPITLEIMATEFRAGDLDTCFIRIMYRDEEALMLLLSRDGAINRMGDGTPPDGAGSTLYIGKVTEPLFDQLMEVIPPSLWEFRHVGRLDLDDRLGEDCLLTVLFGQSDGLAYRFEILFGSESVGVPRELQIVLARALELTEPWWQETRSLQEGGERPASTKAGRTDSKGRRWWRPSS